MRPLPIYELLQDTIVESNDDITRAYNSDLTPVDPDDFEVNQAGDDSFNLEPDHTGRSERESQVLMMQAQVNRNEKEIRDIKTAVRTIAQTFDERLEQILSAVNKPGILGKLLGKGNGPTKNGQTKNGYAIPRKPSRWQT